MRRCLPLCGILLQVPTGPCRLKFLLHGFDVTVGRVGGVGRAFLMLGLGTVEYSSPIR